MFGVEGPRLIIRLIGLVGSNVRWYMPILNYASRKYYQAMELVECKRPEPYCSRLYLLCSIPTNRDCSLIPIRLPCSDELGWTSFERQKRIAMRSGHVSRVCFCASECQIHPNEMLVKREPHILTMNQNHAPE
jgi:hypothetical protein